MAVARREFVQALAILAPSSSLAARLNSAVNDLEIVDTHEHIIEERRRLAQPVDFFTLTNFYIIDDLVSAGLPAASRAIIEDPQASPLARWSAFEPCWKRTQWTGYGRTLRIAIEDLYGISEISAATLSRINDAIRAANRPGLYRNILKQRAGIRFAVLDDNWNAAPVRQDPEFFLSARKFDRYVRPETLADIHALERLTNVSITNLNGLKKAMEVSFERSLAIGMVAVKTTLAYRREILFRETGETPASRDLESLLRGEREIPRDFRRYTERPFRNLEDHMFHHLVRLADAHRLPMQIHTGLLAGAGRPMANADPTLLTNLFFLYPGVTFDLLHIGYPYHHQLAVLAKTFANVTMDFCWAHAISPSVARASLHEALDTVPVNKILGFGGDYDQVELAYAHSRLARENIATVLREKVESGSCREGDAIEIATLLLRSNPLRLFAAARSEYR
jgi:uncharacterized protein